MVTKSAQGRSVRLSGGAKKDSQGLRERPKPPINVMLYGQHPVVEALRDPARRAKTLWLDQGKQDELTRQFEPFWRPTPTHQRFNGQAATILPKPLRVRPLSLCLIKGSC